MATIRKRKGKKGGAWQSVNPEAGCLRQIFKKAVVWDMVERASFERLDSKETRQPENNKRDRFFSKEEIQSLLSECADHLKPIVKTTLHAGLRMGEALGLKWGHIDFKNDHLFVEKAPDNKTKPERMGSELGPCGPSEGATAQESNPKQRGLYFHLGGKADPKREGGF
jgi:hypothetical protein